MKNLLMFLILFSFTGELSAQDDVYFRQKTVTAEKQYKQITEANPSYQIDYVRQCLKKYRDQRLQAYGLQIAGMAIAGAGLSIDENNSTRQMLITGGGLCALSGVLSLIDSEKWMKRAYLGPDGIGVKIKL